MASGAGGAPVYGCRCGRREGLAVGVDVAVLELLDLPLAAQNIARIPV